MDVVTDKAAKARAIIPAFVRLRSLKKKKMSFANIPGRKNGKDASKSASRRTSNLICPPRTKTSVSNLIRDTNRTTLVYCFELRSCRSSRTRSFALKSMAIVSILPLFEWCFTGSNTNEHRVVKFVETRECMKSSSSFLSSHLFRLFFFRVERVRSR